ncbi:hypothetical protein DMENIID0001_160740 [Sergentomyia squamirostris]
MGVIDVILLLIAVIFLSISYVKKKYRYWEDRGVPFVKPAFPKGNVSSMGKSEHFFELTRRLYFELKKEGKMLGGMYFTIQPAVLALDLDFVKTILVKDFHIFHDRGLYVNERDDPLTNNLLALEGDKWKILRSKLSPTFTSGKMKLMFPIMMDIAGKFIACVDRDLEKSDEMEIGDYLSRFTIDIIGSCAFGLDCNSLKDPNAEFLRMGKRAFDNRGRALKRMFIGTFKKLSRALRLQLTRKEISDFYTRIVRETVEYREKENIHREDFLNLLLQLKNKGKLDGDQGNEVGKITFNEVISNAFLFLLAGFETSSTTMRFCLLELAHHPEIQYRVREEIKSVLSNHDNKITYESLSEMKYLEQVINETLRKHPVAGALVRCIKEDYKVPKMDLVLEKGLQVFISVMGIHHDPDIYPEPEKFDPERFTPEAVRDRHPYAFLAFGEGPRNCIGLRFGMMQAKTGIANLLLNYKFSPSANTKYPVQYVKTMTLLSPEGGCWVKIDKIE